MKLKVLGSVSSFEYKEKRGISFLVSSGEDKVLLDLGNGSIGNLSLPEDLNNLTIIISHLHRDHFCDLLPLSYATLVYKNHGIIKNKIKVYIPDDKKSITKKYVEELKDDSNFEIIKYNEKTTLNIGNMFISFRKTIHGPLTFSTKIESDGKVLVYSSDTGYKGNNLETFAKEADLLICETTFLKDEIKLKDSHLTTIEAANIARNANVKMMMINHYFSTRDKMSYLNEVKFVFEKAINANEGEEFEI